MIPYLLLMFLPVVFSCVAFSKNNGKSTVSIGGTREILNHSCLLPVFFMLLATLLVLRDETIGKDLLRYKYYFEQISTLSFRELFGVRLDALYVIFNWLVSRVTDDYQVFLAVVAVVTVVPIAKAYCEDRRHGFLKIVLFMNMSTFVMIFSGLRQSVAVSMGVVAYQFVKKKKLGWFVVAALIACGFHHTGFMIFAFYPLYHIAFKKKHLWFVIPAILLVFIFNRPIFTTVTNWMSLFFNEKYTATISDTGAYTMLLLFIVFAVFSFVIPDEKSMDKEALGLRNLLLMAVVLQCFAPVHMLAMRMNYYFIIFIPTLLPKVLTHAKPGLRDTARLAKVVLIVVLAGYYLLTTYISCQTGVSDLNTYPYVPFWRN